MSLFSRRFVPAGLRAPAAALGLLATLALGVTLAPSAQSQMPQIRANPSYQPVGVSASGNGSTAWFHDPSTGRAIACHMASGGAGPIQCLSARLPTE
ncbi:MAG TPA: hypothetical protein VMS38_20540 [Pseudorhodoferax sp.]|jgi:hypothetical protein|nr:hypothetical protein [Pseudorhodoferax sp.]